jgi:hypothetical protein
LRLWKDRFWLSPLIVGSMAPDYLYYVFPPERYRHFGHSLLGLFVFCIPAGLAVLFAFHAFIKRPLVLLMPRPLSAKLWRYCGPYPLMPLGRLAWIIALIFFGAVTHIVWDHVTHEYGWAVSGNAAMHAVPFTILGYGVHVYGLLQYGSSVGGLLLLARWAWRWYSTAPSGDAPSFVMPFGTTRPAIIAAMIVFACAVGFIDGAIYLRRLHDPLAFREFLAAAFISGADALLAALVAFSVYVHRRHGRGIIADACEAR